MRIIRHLTNECIAWLIHILRWMPGNCGIWLRYCYYKNRLAGCGKNVSIAQGCYIRDCKNITLQSNIGLGLYTQIYASGFGTERIIIGNDVYLNSNVMINADQEGHITIDDKCIIGPNVVFRTSNHDFSQRDVAVRNQGHRPGRITVGKNVWIGANASIIGNVTIGEGAIIGAGAVVNKDIEDFSIAAGIPAKKVGTR